MKEKLHQAERAQLSFAAAASHELRTPLHQINAAASLLRHSLHAAMDQLGGEMPVELASSTVRNPPSPVPVSVSLEDRVEALAQLEIIEANGLALGHILENIIDTLDIGRLSARFEAEVNPDGGAAVPPKPKGRTQDLALVIEDVVKDAVDLETKSRNVAGVKGMEDVEVIVEVLPRVRGQWLMFDDKGPLAR
jgi:signal transduction histidine kinase